VCRFKAATKFYNGANHPLNRAKTVMTCILHMDGVSMGRTSWHQNCAETTKCISIKENASNTVHTTHCARGTELVQVVQSSLNLSLHGAKNQAGQIRP
jgi:hypothetical protein